MLGKLLKKLLSLQDAEHLELPSLRPVQDRIPGYRYHCIFDLQGDSGGLQHRKMTGNCVTEGGRLVLLGGNHALRYTAFENNATAKEIL